MCSALKEGGPALAGQGDAIPFFFSVEAPPSGNGSYLGKYLLYNGDREYLVNID